MVWRCNIVEVKSFSLFSLLWRQILHWNINLMYLHTFKNFTWIRKKNRVICASAYNRKLSQSFCIMTANTHMTNLILEVYIRQWTVNGCIHLSPKDLPLQYLPTGKISFSFLPLPFYSCSVFCYIMWRKLLMFPEESMCSLSFNVVWH